MERRHLSRRLSLMALLAGLALLAGPGARAENAGEQRGGGGGGGNTGGNLPSTAIYLPTPPAQTAPTAGDPVPDGGGSPAGVQPAPAAGGIGVLVVAGENPDGTSPGGTRSVEDWIRGAETAAVFAWSDAPRDVNAVTGALDALSRHPALAGKAVAVVVVRPEVSAGGAEH